MKTVKEYLNKQINNDSLKIGDRIFVNQLMIDLNQSRYSINKQLIKLANYGHIEKFGHFYFLLNLNLNDNKINHIQNRLIIKSKIHIYAYKLIEKGFQKKKSNFSFIKKIGKHKAIIYPIIDIINN